MLCSSRSTQILSQAHFTLPTGVNASFTSPQAGDRPALIAFASADNVTLQDSSLLNVQLDGLGSIIAFNDLTNIAISNLTSNACTADYIISGNTIDTGGSCQVLLQSSQFINSSAGAIWASNCSIAVTDSVFDRLNMPNTNVTDAVLHHDNEDGSLLSIYNCSFSNSQTSTHQPSATVLLLRPNLMLSASQFVNCSASDAAVSIGINPSNYSYFPPNQTATIDSCTFVRCNAQQGAVHMLADQYAALAQQMNLYHNTFESNRAQYGGALTLISVGTVEVIGCTFYGNYAVWGLSAVYVYGGVQQATYFTMHDSAFTANNGTRQKMLHVADPRYSGITDITECGGLYLSSCKCVGISNSTFDGNIGIGLCVHGQMDSAPDCSSSDPVFFNQSTVADTDGQQLLNSFLSRYQDLAISVDIRGSSFVNNTDAFLTRTTAEPLEAQPIDYLTGQSTLICSVVRVHCIEYIPRQQMHSRQIHKAS